MVNYQPFIQVNMRSRNVVAEWSKSVSNNTTVMNQTTEHDGVFLIHKNDVSLYTRIFNPTILKYDIRTDTMGLNSYNFGQCKGLTFDRVLIFPNKSYIQFLKGKELTAPSKYFVAATRPKYSLAFVVESLFNNNRFKLSEIVLDGAKITVSKYTYG